MGRCVVQEKDDISFLRQIFIRFSKDSLFSRFLYEFVTIDINLV